MRNQTSLRTVTDNHGRRCEGQARIFHAAERKRGWQYQNIVTLPTIRAIEFFGCNNHFFGIGKFPCRLFHYRWFRPDAGTLRNRFKHQITCSNRQQIRRNCLRHTERIIAITYRIDGIVRRHQGHRIFRCFDIGRIGKAHAGRVLQRYPRARVDRLRLAEHEGLLFSGC